MNTCSNITHRRSRLNTTHAASTRRELVGDALITIQLPRARRMLLVTPKYTHTLAQDPAHTHVRPHRTSARRSHATPKRAHRRACRKPYNRCVFGWCTRATSVCELFSCCILRRRLCLCMMHVCTTYARAGSIQLGNPNEGAAHARTHTCKRRARKSVAIEMENLINRYYF